MKTVLVPVELHTQTASTLATASLLAKLFGSVVEGAYLRPAFAPPLGMEPASAIVVPDVPFDDAAARTEAGERFASELSAAGLARLGGRGENGPGGFWDAARVLDDELTGRYSRAFDVTVVGRPADRSGGPRMATLESALFESGHPILIAPPTAPATMGRNVAIAWNGSTETARTLAFSRPLLRLAESVTILVGEDERPGPSGRRMQEHLAANGIASELRVMNAASIRSGEAILAECNALGADLLVKGAYTQSRLRQMIFGGATSSIIAKTEMPVLMAH
ncbi:universal stress protein [Aureimonas mangrovi]|uniref:universal stress protein n=1 Tax=Aureimonas mangrovi TaxID=2758041 RepID=UPI00163DAB51|nr:universal stress protein [Aureimonas mangrovi]